ncbi:potassium-transporting ATPase subunit C [Paludisphaera rhizosphaerae]|uniref:potassium-transporting ATPase subunit C n=1 Tax=Paludisphaera rhizosphaerae TaxID=2711216 RepID=UPI0013EBC915|nr:potassium-transporting ATPase subunit C [Paludisphaera rhizosphaerae]
MKNNIRASLILLLATVVLCCGLYPLALFGVGRLLFPSAAAGSLIEGKGGAGSQGSRLIAQPFTAPEYFWPRPSAASYNATASGGSNWGANNPKLRDRVCQQIGPILVYKQGSRSAGAGPKPRTPQQDIDAWFAAVPDRAAAWASASSTGPVNWARTDLSGEAYGLQGEYIRQWANEHPEVLEAWKKSNPNADAPKPEDLVTPFFASFARVHPGRWPGVVEVAQTDGTKVKRIEPVASDPAVHANFFDLWVSDPANRDKAADLEPVIADMVTTSGSGLDPHITLRNALSVYQLDRVAAKRAPSDSEADSTRAEIEKLVRAHAFTPLAGLVGEPLVNVLELNLALDERFPTSAVR